MATAEQIKSLIKSHFRNDIERFYSVALQVAAHEAKQGHTIVANEIRDIIDAERKKQRLIKISLPTDLQGLVLTEKTDIPKSSLVIPIELDSRIERILHEYRKKNKLKSHGLIHRRKILLIGPAGTGKTMTSRILAHELNLSLYTIQVDRLVTKFMGETSSKLRQIFELINDVHGIYLFDEFDAIGGERSMDNDVGEMRRVLNSFLQFIEHDSSDSLIIAATNNPKLLDHALFRRFDDVLYYDIPNKENRKQLIKNMLGELVSSELSWSKILEVSNGLSHAEISHACHDAVKIVILTEVFKVNSSLLLKALEERKATHTGLNR